VVLEEFGGKKKTQKRNDIKNGRRLTYLFLKNGKHKGKGKCPRGEKEEPGIKPYVLVGAHAIVRK